MATADVAQPIDIAPIEPNPSLQHEKSTPHNVQTTMKYYLEPEDGSPPAPTIYNRPETFAKPFIEVPVLVTDITGNENTYTLDNHGFQLHRHESNEKAFDDDTRIKTEYYAETEQLLKDATGATRILIFDHTIRRPARADGSTDSASVSPRGPVRSVHVDQSYSAALSRVAHHLPDEAEQLLQNRFQIINVWRPIKTIYKDPLAVADGNSVLDADLVAIPLIYPARNGETYSVKPNPAHRWYFKYAQKPDEVLLIKCFDTNEGPGVARRAPHSSFRDLAEEGKSERESIEVRCLVFY
ncbi:hypothetical protein B0T19DRAFT_425113 [Cercophora scortea]|uniref:7alpha-cephem-methoxylase P8 chain related protein n=1 Tax=Cercophora scortea TaxID=314031 RepID=A0AAE0IPC0_9PEZI|nr:hypothetical protein B0T19DRAFT_425113 [Cercophora scortea]